MKHLLFLLLLWAGIAGAQTFTYPCQECNNTFTGTNTFNGPVVFNSTTTISGTITASAFVSTTASPALSGVLRGASGDSLACFRSISGAGDVCIRKTGAAAGNQPADMIDLTAFGAVEANSFDSRNANPAVGGVFSCTSTDTCVAFRNNLNTGDIPGLTKNASDVVIVGGAAGISAAGYQVGGVASANTFLKGNGTLFVAGSPVLASADFANQGITTAVLHGNAAGNPSFGSVVSADLNITPTNCTNQAITSISATAGGTCSTITSAFTSGTFPPNAHNLLSASHGDTTTASAVRGDIIAAVGVTPTWQRLAHSATTGGYWKWNGTDVVASTGAAGGTGTCGANTFETGDNADAAPTCTQPSASNLTNGVTGSGAVVLATSPTLTTPAFSSITNAGTITVPSGTDTLVARSTTDTLTNKRVTPRQVAAADATSVTPNSDTTDIVTQTNTQVSGTLTINAPTGTPTDGQKLIIRLKSTNAQTYSFNATYAFSTTVTAPTTLAAGKTDYIGTMWNATNSKWDVVAVDQGH